MDFKDWPLSDEEGPSFTLLKKASLHPKVSSYWHILTMKSEDIITDTKGCNNS